MDLPRIYDQLILAASIAISIAVAVFSWRRRPAVAAVTLSLLASGIAIWSLSDLLQILSPDFEGKLFWSKICYLGIVLIPAAWIIFIMQYTGQDRILTRRNLALLSIEPIATLIFAFTNEYHGLLWSHINRQTPGYFITAGAVYGPWFWVHAAYSYLLLLAGICLLAKFMLRSPSPYRQQTQVLLFGSSIPFISNMLYISRLSPLMDIDLTSFAFSLSGIVFAWGLFRFRLLDIVPVAHDAVFYSLKDSVIVLDSRNRVVNLNRAAQSMIGLPEAKVIGTPINETKIGTIDRVESYLETDEAQAEIELNDPDRPISSAKEFFDMRVFPLIDWHGQIVGRIMVLRDITDRNKALAELKLYQEELEKKVEERTSELLQANQSLKSEIMNHELAEEALRESERSYRLLAENVTDVIWTIDMEGRFTYISPSVTRMNGYSVEEALALTLEDILTPGSFERATEALREAREMEKMPQKEILRLRTLELEARHKDGHAFWAEATTIVLREN